MESPAFDQGVKLPLAEFARLYPFYLAVNHDLLIIQMGASLQRTCRDLVIGGKLGIFFERQNPEEEINLNRLTEAADSITQLWHKASGLSFKGPVLSIDRQILFLWSPSLAEAADLDRHGLCREDFAAHDNMLDFLKALESTKIELQDERDLADKLSAQRAELLRENHELSRQFSFLWDDLVKLKNEEAETYKIALIASNTDSAVVMTDGLGLVEWVNDGFTQITGYTQEEMLGKKPGAILQGKNTNSQTVEYIRKQFALGESFGAEIINYSKSGREYWVQIEVQPIRDEDGLITNWMAIERDISEQKKSEMALLEAKKAAEAANRAKSAFLAMMSHEIRTPMNAVLGTLNLLLDSELDEEQGIWATSAYTAAHALLNIIDDILDFSKIEADMLNLQIETFDLKSLIDNVIQLFRIRTEAKGLGLSFAIDPRTPQSLCGDPFRLRQILVNLIGNAIKFTERGGIFVSVFCQEHTAAKTLLRFHVKDSGIGISHESQATLFNQFVQVDNRASRRYGGTGLGLAISKRLANLMGGDIGVTSRPGEGSDFWFTAQLENAVGASSDTLETLSKNIPSAVIPIRGRMPSYENGRSEVKFTQDRRHKIARILVAEDGEINRMVVTAMLTKAGYEVEVAEDGKKAFKAARSGHYDLILMDVQMPEMDGYETTAAIRGLADERAQVPILAFTANALQEDRNACLAAGMNDFISKPVEKDRLLTTVSQWLRKVTEPEETPSPSAAESELCQPALLEATALTDLAEQTDELIMRETVIIFFSETTNQVQRISQALRERDLRTLGFQAHSIKSAAKTLGAIRLSAICQELENVCKQDQFDLAVALSKQTPEVFADTRQAFIDAGFLPSFT